MCGALVDTAVGSLGAAAARVALLSTDGTRLETVAARGYPDEVRERWSSFPADTKDILGDAIGQRSVVTVASADEALERYPMLAGLGAGYPVGAQAAAPLLTGDELLGVLGVNFRSTRRFSMEDESLLLAIGRQCGQAIERARLFEAERRGGSARPSSRLASALAAAASPSEVASIAALTVVSILGSREVSIRALTSDGRAIEMIAAEGRSLDRSRRLERTALDASSPIADAVGRGGAVLLGSPEELDRRYPELAARYTEAGDRAWVWLPLEASGGSVGTLFVSYEDPGCSTSGNGPSSRSSRTRWRWRSNARSFSRRARKRCACPRAEHEGRVRR